MLSTFGSLHTALSTLHAMQQSIQVSSHNMANAATPGYSRQQVQLTTGIPYSVPANNRFANFGQVGTGVVADSIQRFHSTFIDSQIRSETLTEQGWETRQNVLQQIEAVFNEPSDTGINSHLSSFWNAWHNLATTPDSAAARSHIAETAADFSAVIRDTYRQLSDIQAGLNERVGMQVAQINDLAQRITGLNKTISEVQGLGQQPNDLRDQRDMLLTELAGIVDVDVYETDSGSVMVSLGNHSLVFDQVSSELVAEPDPSNGNFYRVAWADTGTAVQVNEVSLEGGLTSLANNRLNGQLGGTLVARDLILPEKMAQLDTIATTFIDNVNAIHQSGFGLGGASGSALGGTTLVPGTVDNFTLTAPLPGYTSLPSGSYSIEIQDNANTLEFRIVDQLGNPVEIDDASAGGTTTTSNWQSLDLVDGTAFDTGRGIVVDFGPIADHSLSGVNANIDVSGFSLSAVAPSTAELPDDTYYTEVRNNGGNWEFRLVDSTGTAVPINDSVANDGSLTDVWQTIPSGPLSFDTTRGMTINFTPGPYTEAVLGGSATPPPIPAANAVYTARTTQVGSMGAGAATLNIGGFFEGTSASDIDLSTYIKEDHNRIASAAAADSPGDGSVALAIARLEDSTLLNGGTATVGDYYQATVASLGQETQQAEIMTANYGLLVGHLETQQADLSSVSIDEETVNLVQFQRTYQAAARVMTTVDEMLDRVINGMGRVGR